MKYRCRYLYSDGRSLEDGSESCGVDMIVWRGDVRFVSFCIAFGTHVFVEAGTSLNAAHLLDQLAAFMAASRC